MKPSTVAVLDVGKTNKKLSVYNRELQVLAEERTEFHPFNRDGVEVEDTEGLLHWFRQALKKLAAGVDIRGIAITTHGATGALLDENGALTFPVISYTGARGAEVQEEFYDTFGQRLDLHRATCTPDLGFANLAKMFFFVKTRMPDVWARCRHALFYTSYLGYELTGKKGMESTYLGNHSYLWNFAEGKWSTIAKEMGLDRMFPRVMSNSWDLLGNIKPEIAAECGVDPGCVVTQGIHDSNANYLPYLAQRRQSDQFADFLLNSTGTWCVLMRESPTLELTHDEALAKVLFNMDALGRPVRTCIFPAGMEYDTFRAFTQENDASDSESLCRVVAQRKLFVIPGVLPDSTAFPGAVPRVIDGDKVYTVEQLRQNGGTPLTGLGQDYYAALNLALAMTTRRLLDWSALNEGTSIFVEGGFSRNKSYCELLAAMCPRQRINRTNLQEGTSFGAALTAWMLAEKLSLDDIGREFTIQTSPFTAPDLPGFNEYKAEFLKFARKI